MPRIAESELILNNRGAVYHLNVRPEELANTIITVGDPGRVPEVSKHFDTVEVCCEHREFITHTGWLGNKRISVVSTGIGPDNIDIVMNELDALANIDFETRQVKDHFQSLQIFRLGTCGGLQSDCPADSLVAGTHGIGLDNLLHFYQHEPTEDESQLLQQFVLQTRLQNRVNPYISSATIALLKHFVTGFYQGITVTCPGFYGPQGRILRLGVRQPDLVAALTAFRYGQFRVANFEMETSALYGLSRLLGHRCLSLNVVVANRVAQSFSKNSAYAVEKLITTALPIIQVI